MATDVTTVTSAPATTTATGADPSTDPSGSKTASSVNADFNMFLTLLTTQLKNQDPLNPMDSADFAVQLATFSGVEQQTKTNALLQTIEGQIGQGGLAQLSGWIGMEARTAAPTAFSGEPITLAPAAADGADTAVLVVKDAAGKVVTRESVPLSDKTYQWTGKDPQGATLADGTYSFSLESYKNGELLGTEPVASYGKVVEARMTDTGAVLVMAGGAQVQASDVTALRPAD